MHQRNEHTRCVHDFYGFVLLLFHLLFLVGDTFIYFKIQQLPKGLQWQCLSHSCPRAAQHHPHPQERVPTNSSLRALRQHCAHTAIVSLYCVPHSPSHFLLSHINSGYFSLAFFPCKKIFELLQIRKELLHSLLQLHFSPSAVHPTANLASLLFLNISTSTTNNAAMNSLNASLGSCENMPTGQTPRNGIAGQSMCAVIILMMLPNCFPLELYQLSSPQQWRGAPGSSHSPPRQRHRTSQSLTIWSVTYRISLEWGWANKVHTFQSLVFSYLVNCFARGIWMLSWTGLKMGEGLLQWPHRWTVGDPGTEKGPGLNTMRLRNPCSRKHGLPAQARHRGGPWALQPGRRYSS